VENAHEWKNGPRRHRPRDLLLRIGAATTCGTDVKLFLHGGHPRMLEMPVPFGREMAGTVGRVGDGVDGIAPS
jgi:L-iditol 2-dehydrogenase